VTILLSGNSWSRTHPHLLATPASDRSSHSRAAAPGAFVVRLPAPGPHTAPRSSLRGATHLQAITGTSTTRYPSMTTSPVRLSPRPTPSSPLEPPSARASRNSGPHFRSGSDAARGSEKQPQVRPAPSPEPSPPPSSHEASRHSRNHPPHGHQATARPPFRVRRPDPIPSVLTDRGPLGTPALYPSSPRHGWHGLPLGEGPAHPHAAQAYPLPIPPVTTTS